MSGSLYLRRNQYGVFHYRRRIPHNARAAFDGRYEVVRSLATTSRRDAIPLAQALNLDVEQQIRKALSRAMPEKNGFYYLLSTRKNSARTSVSSSRMFRKSSKARCATRSIF